MKRHQDKQVASIPANNDKTCRNDEKSCIVDVLTSWLQVTMFVTLVVTLCVTLFVIRFATLSRWFVV